MSTAVDPRECPYVGLDPFESAHTEFFFGRRRESKVIADHVLVRPVTVLYGASGVGKSSLLNVGLPTALEQIAAAERAQADTDDPAASISERVDGDFIVKRLSEWQEPEKVEQLIAGWAAETVRRPILVILDQFEEYFLYREGGRARGLDRAVRDLAARRDQPVHLLFGIRDDALHQLDQLRAFVPGILETMIELRGLDDPGIREAIVGPITRYNEEYRDKAAAIVVEDGLVTTLIHQLKDADTEFNKARRLIHGAERRVELPYLQLALRKLWIAEGSAHAIALREATLVGRLGGVRRIVRDHVNGVMDQLTMREQALCAKMFDRLVTSIGGKIAYPTAALATPEVVGPDASAHVVEAILNKLTGREQRILKPVTTNGGGGFELFHDVLGTPVLEWKRNFEAKRKEAVLARLRVLVAGLLVVMVAGVAAWWNQDWLRDRIYAFRNVRALAAEQERTLKPGESFKECTDCPEMIVVPARTFTMGSPMGEGEHDEHPQHDVTLAKPLAVAKYELTFDQWDECVAQLGCPRVDNDMDWGRAQRPVINISWFDARRYVSWLSRVTNKPYRLLSEAEWEYAARAGTPTAYPWGNDIGQEKANCTVCGGPRHNQTTPVGSFPANQFGLYDMAGNVWEWMEDCYHGEYDQAPTDGSAWTAGTCSTRVVRGGGWWSDPIDLRSAARYHLNPKDSGNNLGFRIARTLVR